MLKERSVPVSVPRMSRCQQTARKTTNISTGTGGELVWLSALVFRWKIDNLETTCSLTDTILTPNALPDQRTDMLILNGFVHLVGGFTAPGKSLAPSGRRLLSS